MEYKRTKIFKNKNNYIMNKRDFVFFANGIGAFDRFVTKVDVVYENKLVYVTVTYEM